MTTEFDLIRNVKSKYGLGRIGDDCAVLPLDGATDMVVTADMLVENVDFRLEWATPEMLGHKSLAVSLSDVAAMGAEPVWAMLSIGVPAGLWKTGFVESFYEGWMALARRHNVELVGGDVSRTPEHIVIDSIAGGRVAKGNAILRSGAQPGNGIFVTGSIGGAAGALKMLLEGGDLDNIPEKLLQRQREPSPQLILAKTLQIKNLISSMIDISDGLSSDLDHLCEASGVGARIDARRLPIDVDLAACFSAAECIDLALNGGEDFELLFTSTEKRSSELELLPVTRIGEITANIGVIELVDGDSTRILEPRGYRHF